MLLYQIFTSDLFFKVFSRWQDKVRVKTGHFSYLSGRYQADGEEIDVICHSASYRILTSKYFQETFTSFHTPSVDTSTRFFDEHFNKYHPKIPKRGENIVHQEEGYHYPKPLNHYKKPVVSRQPYSVSNFEPEFFKQFYDSNSKHFLPVRSNTNKFQMEKKRTILKNKDPKKFAFPTFETF